MSDLEFEVTIWKGDQVLADRRFPYDGIHFTGKIRAHLLDTEIRIRPAQSIDSSSLVFDLSLGKGFEIFLRIESPMSQMVMASSQSLYSAS